MVCFALEGLHKTKWLYWPCLVSCELSAHPERQQNWNCYCTCGRPKLTSREKRNINSRTPTYLFVRVHDMWVQGGKSPGNWVWTDVVLSYARNPWEWTKYHRFRALNIPKYEHHTRKIYTLNSVLVRSLCFLVISTVLGFLCHHCYSSPFIRTKKPCECPISNKQESAGGPIQSNHWRRI